MFVLFLFVAFQVVHLDVGLAVRSLLIFLFYGAVGSDV